MNQIRPLPRSAAAAPARSAASTPVPNPLPKLLDGDDLPRDDCRASVRTAGARKLEPAEIAGMLIALRMKGETADEMIGAAQALRAAALPFERPDYLFADCCGTGGDCSGLINVSTASAFVAAACGLPDRQARQPQRQFEVRVGRRAGGARREDRHRAAKARADARPDRVLLPVRAGLPSRA